MDQIVIEATKPVRTVTPIQALGAALDGMESGEVDRYLTPANIAKMRSAGLRRITYRLRPELAIQAWHWSEEGQWSDPGRQQGYWTSSDNPRRHPRVTWGYNLPRRGDSVDQAADNGYSRLDDGDPATFWKSNPYLDREFTGAAETRPQWIVVSFEAKTPIDAARIQWGAPFARHFLVQYWNRADPYDDAGRWVTFPHGNRTIPKGPGDEILRLADAPVMAQYLRILLLQSSKTAPPGSTDIRDRLGFAVREIAIGATRPDGGITDAVVHGTSRDAQTLIQVSSTDPWHRAIDRNLGAEQPSLDLIFAAGLNGGLPLMVPVGTFYDTPENAAAEVRYLKRRGYPFRQVELGEEPDGQFIAPEDYADLYLETARAIRAVDPTLSLGGPSMQEATTDSWPDPEGGRSWIKRFVARLQARGAIDQLNFFSFEHYPFDEMCGGAGQMLRDETGLMDNLMAQTAASGVPRTIPWVVSEYGFSPFSGRAMSEMPSALLAADIVGHFLTLGGAAAYMFGYTPDVPANQNSPCAGYGNMMLYQADAAGRARWPMPVYYAEQMMIDDWSRPADAPHELYAASSARADGNGHPFVVAYPLRTADGHWTVMLINRDGDRARRVDLVFRRGDEVGAFAIGQGVEAVQYSPMDYVWRDLGEASHPVRDLPPRRFRIAAGQPIVLPAYSITVLGGRIGYPLRPTTAVARRSSLPQPTR